MIIRNAKEKDASQLITLLMQMGPKYEMNLKNMKGRIAAFNSKGHQIVVAEQDDIIIGLIAFGCYEQFRIPGSCCHIDTLVVDKNHKGKGIGKQLVMEAEKYAQEQGAITMELITANFRRSSGTHAFYESLGYKDHLVLDYSYFSKERSNKHNEKEKSGDNLPVRAKL
jgi:GNAT superfamily N-acetyltransferase